MTSSTAYRAKDYASVKEAAEFFDVGRETIRRWIEAGKLPAVRLPSGAIRVRRDSMRVEAATNEVL